MAPRSQSALLGADAGARAAAQTPEAFDEAAEREEQRLISEAMDDTEREIAAEAFEQEPQDLDGDTSIEDAAGEDELADEETEDEDEPADDEQAEPSPEDEIDDATEEAEPQDRGRGDLSVALRQERERRQALERELAEARGYQRGVESIPRQTQQQEQPPPRPDMFSDPEGWERAVRAEAAQAAVQQVRGQFIQSAMEEAAAEYGQEFHYAWDRWNQLPDSDPKKQEIGQRMGRSLNPGRVLMRWAEPLLEEYRAQQQNDMVERFMAMADENPQLLDALSARLGGGGRQRQSAQRDTPQPRTQQRSSRRNPPSINGASGSSGRVGADPRGFDGSEEAIFSYAFDNS